MTEPRVYRAAFLPALLVLALLLFSFEPRPAPAPQGLAADVLFDGRLAAAGAREVARDHPDRRPGTPGAEGAARDVAGQFEERGFVTRTDAFESRDGTRLVNVVGVRPGASPRRLVLMAARDSARGPDAAGSAADTAALLELVRVLAGRATRKTLVLASVDGATLSEAGARRFVEAEVDRGLVDAVLVVSDLGASRSRGPIVVEWASDASRASVGWQRTVAESVAQEVGGAPGQEGSLGQLVRLALPVGVGAQGPLLAEGLPALRLSGSGELSPPPSDVEEEIDATRLGDLGRASLRALSALDAGPPPESGPPAYLTVSSQVLPGWMLWLLALALLLPAPVAAVDALARARRRREPVARWVPWLGRCGLPFVVALALAYVLRLFGVVPSSAEAAPAPDPAGVPGAGLAALAGLAVAVAACFAVLAWRARGRDSDAEPGLEAPGAACACALLAAGLGLAVWWVNPFAGLLAVPTVHLWMVAAVRRRSRRPGETVRQLSWRGRAALVLGGLVVPLGVAIYYADRLELGPIEGLWYGLLLAVGGHAGLGVALLGALFLGLLTAVVSIVVRTAREAPPTPEGGSPGGGGPPRERVAAGVLGRSFYRPTQGVRR